MAQIMTQGDGFGQIFVKPKGSGNGAGNAADLDGMGHTGTVVVAFRLQEHLGFVHQAAKRFAVDDAVRIPLIAGTDIAFSVGIGTAFAFGRFLRLRCQHIVFSLFQSLPNRHILPSCIV